MPYFIVLIYGVITIPSSYVTDLPLQNGVSFVVHRRVDCAMAQQLLGRSHDVLDGHPGLARDDLHVYALSGVSTARQIVEHLLRLDRVAPVPRVVAVVYKHAVVVVVVVPAHHPTITHATFLGGAATREEQVHIRRLEEVVVDLVEVAHGLDDVRADVPLVAEGLKAAPHAHIVLLPERRARVRAGVLLVGVKPLLHLDHARAVVDAVRDVRRLLHDGADLPDDGHLLHVQPVDPEGGIAGVGRLGVDDLLDRYRAERFVIDGLEGSGQFCFWSSKARFMCVYVCAYRYVYNYLHGGLAAAALRTPHETAVIITPRGTVGCRRVPAVCFRDVLLASKMRW